MALIRTSSVVSEISGAVGGTIFSTGKHGSIMATRPQRKNTPSVRQATSRAIFRTVQAQWSLLSLDTKAQWNNLASQSNVTNRVGLQRQRAGQNMFTDYLMFHLYCNSSSIPDFPASTFVNPFVWESLVGPTVLNGPTCTSQNTIQTSDIVAFYGRRSFSTSHAPRGHRIFVFGFEPGFSGAEFNLATAWTAIFQILQAGEIFDVSARLAINGGLPSRATYAQAVWTP